MRRAIALALAACTIGGAARAQNSAAIIVVGSVRNPAGVAVSGAEVWVEGTNLRQVANDSGEFRIVGAPPGRVRVRVRRLGFRPDSKRLSLKAGDRKQVQFVLDGLPDQLEAVIVTAPAGASPRMQEFWARRMLGIGVFLTRADIERRHPTRTADLFRGVMGVSVVPGGALPSMRIVSGRQSISSALISRPGASGACALQYYMDGVSVPPGAFSVDDMPPEAIEAIEIYRGASEVPVRFRQRDTLCGLVVIWSREPPPRARRER